MKTMAIGLVLGPVGLIVGGAVCFDHPVDRLPESTAGYGIYRIWFAP